MPPYSLGRRPQPDPRNANFPLRALLPEKIVRTSKVWAQGAVLDQGDLSACTGFGWVDFLACAPEPRLTDRDTVAFAVSYYSQNTKNDDFPGTYPPDDTGSSNLAGAKTGQQFGLISAYHWAFDVDDIIDALVTTGPVVVGSDWTNGMFSPDAEYLIRCTGDVAGGHLYTVRGVLFGRTFSSGPKDVFVIQNSWGTGWGDGGDCYVEIGDFAKLWANEGDACLAVKASGPVPAPEPPPFSSGCLSLSSLRTFARRLRARIGRRKTG